MIEVIVEARIVLDDETCPTCGKPGLTYDSETEIKNKLDSMLGDSVMDYEIKEWTT